MKLTYAYAYIKSPLLKNIKLSTDNNKIIDITTNNIVMDLINIPNNNLLYKIHIQKIDSKINNIKIIVNVDYELLKNLISSNKNIPNKKHLFLLLKRNYIVKYNNNNNNNNNNKISINYKKIVLKDSLFYKNNYIKIKDLVIDFDNENMYVDNNTKYPYYLFNLNLSIVYSFPNINLLKKIINKDKILIISNYENFMLLEKHLSKYKYTIITNTNTNTNTKINIVNINLLLNNKNLINETDYKSVILFDLSNTIRDLHLIKKYIYNKKIVIVNQKNRKIIHEDYFNLLIDNSCIDNINTFNKCIINIETNHNVIFSHKILNKYSNSFSKNQNNKLINNIYSNLNQYDRDLYNSISENIINFNNIKLLESKYTKTKTKILGDNSCSICFNKIKKSSVVITNCSHLFCDKCILKNLMLTNKCPQCRTPIILNKLYKYETNYSDKLNYIYNSIKPNTKDKILVISYYQESLKTINDILKHKNIKCTILKKKEDEESNLYLINIRNLLIINNFKNYKRIIYLENNYKEFDYYKYLFINKIKRKVDVLEYL